jgi:uncharacterized protein (PEP-CTERM system associated)
MRKAAVLFALLASQASLAGDWTIEPRIRARETYNDNIFGSGTNQKSDFITDISPGLRLRGDAERLKVNADYTLQTLTYLDNSSQNTILNNLNSTAKLEALKDFFFIDADAYISQQSVSPFGPSPSESTSVNANRFESRSLGLSPYVRGKLFSDLTYDARYRIRWNTSNSGAIADSETTQWTGRIASPVRLFGWSAEYNQNTTDFQGQAAALDNKIYRGRLFFQPISSLRLQAIGGYEENNYVLTNTSNNIYGAGFSWKPNGRNSVEAEWEQRFFGPSYLLNAEHKTPLSTWSVNYSRNISTSPQEVLSLPPGNSAAFLNTILASRIPDDAERIAAIQNFFNTTGLSPFLTNSLAFYSQQIFLMERLALSAAFQGRRNLVSFTLYWVDISTVSASQNIQAIDALGLNSHFKQQGAALDWNHRFSGSIALDGILSRRYTKNLEPVTGDSVEDRLQVTLTRTLSPHTNVSAGFTLDKFTSESTGFNSYNDATLFAGIDHRF